MDECVRNWESIAGEYKALEVRALQTFSSTIPVAYRRNARLFTVQSFVKYYVVYSSDTGVNSCAYDIIGVPIWLAGILFAEEFRNVVRAGGINPK